MVCEPALPPQIRELERESELFDAVGFEGGEQAT